MTWLKSFKDINDLFCHFLFSFCVLFMSQFLRSENVKMALPDVSVKRCVQEMVKLDLQIKAIIQVSAQN